MEDYSFVQEPKSEELIVSPQAREFLRETARWAKFLSIIGIIMLVFMVIASFFMGAIMSSTMSNTYNAAYAGYRGFSSWFFSLIYLFMAAIYIAPIYFLYQFSNKTRIALESNDTQMLTESLGFLKSHYKYIGILTIVVLAVYALIFVVAFIVGIVAGISSI